MQERYNEQRVRINAPSGYGTIEIHTDNTGELQVDMSRFTLQHRTRQQADGSVDIDVVL
jgi:hypothetical protein